MHPTTSRKLQVVPAKKHPRKRLGPIVPKAHKTALTRELIEEAGHNKQYPARLEAVLLAALQQPHPDEGRGGHLPHLEKLIELQAVATFLLLHRKADAASCPEVCCGEKLVLQLVELYRWSGRLSRADVREAIDDYESNLAFRDQAVELHQEAEGG
jgi:hypothetical protein